MARKFLYVIAVLIVLAVAALFTYRIWGTQLTRFAFLPSVDFTDQPDLAANAYADPKMWFSRPGKANDPSHYTPPGVGKVGEPAAAVFFVHPTSFVEPRPDHWNAALDDQTTNDRAVLFLRGQASAFNAVGTVWAPRYRQAAFGAFLTSEPSATRALDLAYHDVAKAFDRFVIEAGDRPIILAGHSQGAYHLSRLLREKVAGTPLAKRVVAAYVVGWPISKTADLPALGLPECTTPTQTGCIASWLSFGEPADPALFLDTFDATTGFTGLPRKGTDVVCTNPLTGTADGAAPASANLGTLITSSDLTSGTLTPGRVPARCAGRGLLLIGDAPDLGSGYVLPGNNYHVYDYSLFWADVRADAARRLTAFEAARSPLDHITAAVKRATRR